MAVATAVIISENIANAPRPPQSHVAGLGMNEMKATTEYIAKIVMARLIRKFFIVFDLIGKKMVAWGDWSSPYPQRADIPCRKEKNHFVWLSSGEYIVHVYTTSITKGCRWHIYLRSELQLLTAVSSVFVGMFGNQTHTACSAFTPKI